MSLAEAEYDHRAFQGNSEDARLYVKFYRDVMRDDTQTTKQGRPIFKELDFIMIQTPGDLLKVVKRPARESDQQRFPRQWDAYSRGQDQETLSGTPLAHWPMVNRAQVEELAYFKVKTVEQLANVPDVVGQKFMGIQQLKQAAKDWLGRAENSVEIVSLRNKNTELEQSVDELKATVRDLSQKLAAMPQPRERAR